LAVEVTTERRADWEVFRDVSAERFVEATVDRESVRVSTAEMSEDVVTDPMDDVAETVDESDCELREETCSRE
jgi:hypothetical protein